MTTAFQTSGRTGSGDRWPMVGALAALTGFAIAGVCLFLLSHI